MSTHQNSLEAYWAGREHGFSQRERMILAALRVLGEATDRQLQDYLELPEPNCVRPRITELLKDGLLQECGDAIDEHTHKRVRRVRITWLPVKQAELELSYAR